MMLIELLAHVVYSIRVSEGSVCCGKGNASEDGHADPVVMHECAKTGGGFATSSDDELVSDERYGCD